MCTLFLQRKKPSTPAFGRSGLAVRKEAAFERSGLAVIGLRAKRMACMCMKSIEEIREFFAKDAFATNAGGYIEEVGDNYSVCSMPVDERHVNAVGNVMGGVYFTLADFAFAVATNHEKPNVVSLDSTINFLGIAKGKKIFAKAECVKDGRTTCVYVVTITDEGGKEVARVTTTGYKFV